MDKQSASVADARVDELWTTLDMRKQGYLDTAGLKKGLRKLDHRTCRCTAGAIYAKRRCSFEKCRPSPGRGHEGCRYGW
jgi:hypothetical protein